MSKRWTQIKVGDVVKVMDNELFPADLLCLHCDLDERICFVKTTNLDGETNLKVKRCAAMPCLQAKCTLQRLPAWSLHAAKPAPQSCSPGNTPPPHR